MPEVTVLPRGPLMSDVAGLTLTKEESVFLQHPAVGAVILFSRNYQSPDQLQALVTEIKALRQPEILIAVDQEGGRVQRFREHFVSLPPLQTIGADINSDPQKACQRAYHGARLMALELRQYGIDFSFAPVLDLADLQSQIIGDRGFHADPSCISRLASAYIDGMNSAGMQATGKHFPGHGGVLEDSHLQTPVDQRDLDSLRQHDMQPYRELGNRLAAVMTAHIAFPDIDRNLPTFSDFWIQTILRRELGFNGLVFSDDLTMKGAEGAGSPAQRADLALGAGCDMILICNDPEASRQVADHLGDDNVPNQDRLARMVGGAFEIAANEIERLVESLA